MGRNSRERFPPQFRSRSASRFRFCDEVRQTALLIPMVPELRHSSLNARNQEPASIGGPRNLILYHLKGVGIRKD